MLLGNPPWDKVDFKDQEYFSAVEPSIAALAGQKRRARIAEWEGQNPDEGVHYRAAKRAVKASFHFFGDSGVFPMCAKGLTLMGVTKLQTDQLFAERFAGLAAPVGRMGCVIPTAIATAAGGQYLFRSFARRHMVASLYDFENRQQIFPGVHASYKFCLLSLAGKKLGEPAAKFAFYLLAVVDLDAAGRVFALSPEEITLINPNTGTLPVFRTTRDASITAGIYQRIPVLLNEADRQGNSWGSCPRSSLT